jgi:hypothetical protein
MEVHHPDFDWFCGCLFLASDETIITLQEII